MRIIAHSPLGGNDLSATLGLIDYSYYFVLRDFLPVMKELGDVVIVADPAREVDALSAESRARGEDCVFLSFLPPQKTTLGLQCPTIPFFAWEFYSIPTESWQGDVRHDWQHVFSHTGRALTHAKFIVDATRQVMGPDFPIAAIPSPVWDKFADYRAGSAHARGAVPAVLRLRDAVMVDTRDPAIVPYIQGHQAKSLVARALRWHTASTDPRRASADVIEVRRTTDKRLPVRNQVDPPRPAEAGLIPKWPEWQAGDVEFELSGVVFTAVFNPYDGRKNWRDMLTAFCAAFRETPDATLVFKLSHQDYESAMHDMLITLARMPKFQCRIVLLHGFLDDAGFESLISATTFIVNASHGEGQCLPLMEFLSCGVPAVAPCHSAMADYIDDEIAFVVDSWLDATAWSHDPRLAYRTLRHQIDWQSLRDAYRDAYDCATREPDRYQRMSTGAINRMQRHCSRNVVREQLREFLVATAARSSSGDGSPVVAGTALP